MSYSLGYAFDSPVCSWKVFDRQRFFCGKRGEKRCLQACPLSFSGHPVTGHDLEQWQYIVSLGLSVEQITHWVALTREIYCLVVLEAESPR